MKKVFGNMLVFFAALTGAILFASCDFGFDESSFQNKAAAYFKEMTSTASIEKYKINPDNVPTDKYGNFCFSYEDTCSVEFTLRNPQHYLFESGRNMTFELAQSGLPGSDLVSIAQDPDDPLTIRMTFPAEFLAQNAAGADISPLITLMHPVSLAQFPIYDKLKLSSNSPPPMVGGALTMQTRETPSRWVLCFNLPSKAMVKAYHSDIVSVTVNEKTFAATVADDGTISFAAGSELSTTAPSNIVANQNTGLSFAAGENSAYFLTGDEADEKEKIYTVVVTDNAGLSSTLAVSTRGFKLGAPDAFDKTDAQFANKFKIYDSADPGGTKNSVYQDEDDSVYVTIKAEPKTASFDYADPTSGATKHVDAYDYDASDACLMWEVYRDEDFLDFVSAGKINGLKGSISIPAGTSYIRAYVRKPLYSDSEVITWMCRAVFTKFYVSEEGDDNAEGSKNLPYRTIQRAVDAFIDAVANGDCPYDGSCDIRVMTDLTTPASYDYGLNNDCLIDVSSSRLYNKTIKISGDRAVKEVSAAQSGTAIRKLVNATYGKTIIEKLNLTGGAVKATSGYTSSSLIYVKNGATLNINNSKIYGNALTSATTANYEASVVLNSGSLAMSGTTICDNTATLTGGGSYEPGFYALWSVITGAASGPTELTDCEITGHGENWTVVYADGLPIKMTGGSIRGNNGCKFAVKASGGGNTTLAGVSVTDNACDSAAVYNVGAMTLDGCAITGNTVSSPTALAGGVINLDSFTSLTLKGKNTIYDNHPASAPAKQSNLYIPYGKTMDVGGNLTGSKIGVYMPFDGAGAVLPTADAPVAFTTNYAKTSYANPAKPGNVFIAENGYSVAAMPSGTSAGEAAFAVSSGGMYGADDYTITLDMDAVSVEPGEEKTVLVAVAATRKESGASPTDLWYNSADKKFYLESDHSAKAAGDCKVEWKADLLDGTFVTYSDLQIGTFDDGITVTVPAISYESDFTLRVEAAFMGTITKKSVDCKVKVYEYPFHSTPTLAPSAADDSLAGATYIYFGDWPQTVLPLTSSVTVDESQTMKQGAFTYYKGSDKNWYAKSAENANAANFKYSDGSTVGQGGSSYRYFKVEPIKWRVINEDYNGLGNFHLLAERILTANIRWYDSREPRTIGSETIKHYNYEHSRIRAYLNGISYNKVGSDSAEFVNKGFLQSAFDSDGQAAISQVTVANNDYAGADTNDKVFLVGYGECTSYRKRKVTDFALANNAWKDSSSGCGYWWTRTPGSNYDIYYYNNVGSGSGDPRYGYGYPQYGVVPCLVIPPLP